MYYRKFFITLLCLLSFFSNLAQTSIPTINKGKKIEGLLLDEVKKTPLPYANIIVLHKDKGGITNEKGFFSIDVTDLTSNDTISFQYVGYQPKTILIGELKNNEPILLKEEVFSLSEFFVFANNHNAEDIIKNVLKYKALNYKNTTSQKQFFVRERAVSDIDKIDIKFKKSSFAELNEKIVKLVEKKIPKHSISYTDFLGDFYFSKDTKDSLKINPTKIVSLKDKDLADLNQLESMFEKLFANTKENEYWKVKSGIIGGKVELNNKDSITNKDSLTQYHQNNFHTYFYTKRMDRQFRGLLVDKKKWDFLYNTNHYNYTLFAGTKINGEDVYIIDFTPKKKGEFIGRVYISMKTFALIKADFHYDVGKIGTNIQLLGVGYSENQLDISVYFEKHEDNYQLKYYAEKTGNKISFERNLSLIKKKKRFLIDKELNEIKVKLNLFVKEENSIEMLVLKNKNISDQNFINFKPKNHVKIVFVNQFDDSVWKGYDVIEPTKQMRDYKKIE